MYLSFRDICLICIKAFLLTLIFLGLFFLIHFDYCIGISYCELLNIPKDFALTIVSPGMAIEVAIIMLVIEMVILFLLIKKLKRIKLFNSFCDFLSLDY